ncbi:glycoside hydrolase family 97 protein [Mucilaginibacter rubeus]|uniref:Glycoside hydrolase family 97 N-terminal domain-containing protein n=2 Tax=Mucilaginibacter rubeus TaxID=2027860 RepID=A0AAE6JPI2_9SPHI|nr:glycoside hydrolase family 97 protein [Mucilaginibacter rubeus]QTE47192.1 glycoside hydrolase family 97 N-terminal domain-containing protein [Mucilaginibacter rubeus]QTE53789.1 glycoside hydrolase family 97 N-terminal domain-containing protein [Mucilaginibacter rubeus]QTE60303.1 glycoside hydrolase family 97 N-terminal domain-containing protein [Mucilaginibacter rubeus]QTE66778.1 glycoside hydrolase family 97 N-terminal domain-containing protein [Mucilaginibacter rubeus]
MAYVFFFFSVNGQTIVRGSQARITSPDKHLVLEFYQKSAPGNKKTMCYSVSYKDKSVIRESVLDLQLDNHLSESAMALKIDQHEKWCENLAVTGIDSTAKDTSWKPVYGEKSMIRDHYNALTIKMVKDDHPIYKMNVEIRAYNEGIAFRFFFPENEKGTYYRIVTENTTFSLPPDTKAWVARWAQAPYQKLPLSNWQGESERPLTLELPNGLYACLAEAQMVDYARTKFKLSNTGPNTIVTSMDGAADLISPVGTPWRVIMVAEKAGDLIQNNNLILNLNEPGKIKDTKWIKPGKIMRVMSQTTADAKANIDFAAQHNLQYILFDWKWYGPAFSFSSDATKVAIPNFDLPGIIRYGEEKGIGVWLYVNQQALVAQSDSLFAVYQKWGVKGVKFGFVQVGSHRWTTWIEKAIQQAAAAHIMVNIHDDWRPTGEQRTWPNLMSAEGIRGNEEMPDATHNTVLPFTRYIAGAADYTICYFDKRIKTTHAHQLALAVIYYSPLQTLYWYDKPSAAHNEPELEFWDKIPATWDETRIIQGKPGEYITTTRRSGKDWFVGTITNNDPRSLKLALDFLPKGRKYLATLCADNAKVSTVTHVGMEKLKVDSRTVLDVSLAASGGQAIYLTPEINP